MINCFQELNVDVNVPEEEDNYHEVIHQEDYKLQEDMCNKISFTATLNKYFMYCHQPILKPDAYDFNKVAVK